ncbi:T9SS type B sorting domain-containing protein [Tenacibaculum discolor]|nr:T9SS type B sorting domain-containing protein [Tenacibaculum discolor]RLJ99677.1 gliding motility-associated-like protein [Tenacibaculum discolor]
MKRIITLLILVLQTFFSFSQEEPETTSRVINEAKGYAKLKASLSLETQNTAAKLAAGFNQRTIKPDGTSGGINIKGDITFIANNVLSRDRGNQYDPEYPYDGSSSNGNLNMQYIDIDSDASTFSSSSDVLSLPTCSRVVYAGLYWAGVYPYETWNYDNRSGNPNQIKFKLPGGVYQDITADETVYDQGFSYVYYKDITSDIQGLSAVDPEGHNGTYVGANIRATRGNDPNGLGGSAGWTMVVIYENQTLSSKNIAIFDGYADVDGNNDVELSYSGFTTVPVGNPANPAPVRVSLLAATLEGDRSISGDRFQIEDIYGNYVSQSTPNINPSYNFFNGSISINDQYLTSRIPDSENTLGFDVDLYELSNTNNSVITNGQNSANVRFTTSGDVYWPFLNALAVEIIEPELQMVKSVLDGSGNDIQGTPVGLGSELWYNISFQNVGTDDATNTIITDRLPKNVDLLETSTGGTVYNGMRFDIDLPAGVSIVGYEGPSAANGFRAQVEFGIPDDMVRENGAEYNIRLHVQVVSDCNELRDVCSNVVQNQAFARYEGVKGGVVVNNEPSYSGFDSCDFGIVGSSNFLVNLDDCDFRREEVLCGGSIELTAGDGFDTYSWEDENGQFLGSTQSITVSSAGVYTVTKTTTLGCITKPEIIEVISFANVSNPLAPPFADRFNTSCTSNTTELAEIYLCGNTTETRDITLPFAGSNTTVEWFKLNGDGGCGYNFETEDCAPTSTGCSWGSLGTDLTQSFGETGAYKLEVLYDGTCPRTYYFNVFRNSLTPTVVPTDILCGTNGSIVVNGVPDGYEYSLSGNGSTTAFQTSNTFSITNPGDYTVTIRQVGSNGSCNYVTDSVNIQSLDIDLNVLTNIDTCGGASELTVQIGNVPGRYSYEIRKDNVYMAGSNGFIDSNDQRYAITESGTYEILVTTEGGCSANETRVITLPEPITLSAITTKNITCENGSSSGIITLTPSEGTSPYEYAVISVNGNPVADVDKVYFTDTTYEVPMGSEGTYVFEVRDDNNCSATAEATVVVEPALQFTATPTNIACNGDNNGTIQVTLTGGDATGYTLEYSIDGFSTTNNTGVFSGLSAGSYTIDIRASKNTYQCTYQLSATITEPQALSGGSAVGTDLECNSSGGTTSGTITFTVPTGGTPNYTYYYKLSSESTYTLAANNPVTGLSAGTYNTRAVDSNGCSLDLNNVVIDGLPSAPRVTSSVVYNCDGTGNITITATPAGTYTYTLNGNSNNTGVFDNVAVGAHTVEVTYGGSCIESTTVTVNAGNEFSGSIVGSTDSECYGSDNGTVTISANNVIGGSFEYSTDGGTTWSMTADNPYRVVGLAAGTYNIFIRETANGQTCPIDLGNVVINQPEELTLSASATQEVTCNTATGTITASATGGIPPYTFSIDGGATWQSSPVFSNVPPRATDYIVMVRDSRSCNECGCTANLFENGGFELPANSATTYQQMNEDLVPGWDSTASDNLIEIWYNGYNGVNAHEGNAFAELNANTVSSLYQEYCTQPGDVINWSVAHRGRSGTDVATVKIGSDLATASVVETMSDGTSAWGVYSGTYTVPVGQSTTVIAFDALSTAGGNNTIGNFIDDVQININRTNCVPVSVPIVEPASVDFTVTPIVCYDGSNGTLTINVTSGNDDYQFSLDGGATWQTPNAATPTEYIFTGLTDGTYDVTVQDGKGCSDTQSATILPQVTATVTTVSATCNDGQIVITPSGGDGTYQYYIEETSSAIAPITTTTSPVNVPSGTYTVYVRDKNGGANYCEFMTTVTVNQIADPTLTTSAVQPDCSTDTGTINVTVASGTAPYTVTVTGPGAPPAQGPLTDVNYTFTGLGDGTYQVTVTDANGCTSAASTETITVPSALTGGSVSSTDLMCSPSGTVLGTITFTAPTGGTPNYLYFYKLTTDTNYTQAGSTTVTNLSPGTYDTRVVDANGCILDLNQATILDLPTEPVLSSSVAYNCDGTGNITITPLDATYTYTLDGGTPQTGNNVFNNVSVGAHTISVGYGSSCTTDITVNVEPSQEFTAAVIGQTNPTCIGDSDGTITVEASFPSGAPASFDYSIDGGATWVNSGANPFAIPGFSAGTHNIQIRPTGVASGCDVPLASVTLSDPTAITVIAPVTKEVTCNPATGATITPTASNGNGGPYTYELFDSTNTSVSTTSPFTDVAAGTYTVVATDRLGCTSAPVSVTVNPVTIVTFTVTPVVCYDGSNGTLTINVTSGNDDYQFSLDNGTTWQTPNAATPTEYTFTGLTDGTYDITVQDGKGCSDTQSATILPQVTATVTTVSATCNDGQIVITPSGGDGTYQYYIEETSSAIAPITTTTSPVNVPSGTYTVYVRDKNGGANYCEFMTTVTVNQIADPTLTTSAVQPDCSTDTGTINVTVASGTAPYTVTVTGPGAPPAQGPLTDVNYTFTGLGDGTYQVTVTDANGCTSAASTETITVPSALTGGSVSSTDLMCSPSGTVLGTITFTAPTGGTPNYLYFYKLTTDTNYTQAGSTTVTNLSPGTYDTRVVDANGCILDLNQATILDLPTEPVLSSSVAYNCDGTGNITITPLDATYTYTLDGGTPQTGNNVFNNVSVGAHTISVGYGSSCTTDITVNVEPSQEFTAAVIGQTNPTCIGDSDGTITVEASFPSGAPASFDYSIDGGATWVNSGANPFAIPGFSAGTHNIQIRPTGVASGCDVPLASVTLSDPTAITVTAPVTKEVTCNPATGATITPTASNGNGGPYTYELFDSTNTSVSTTSPFTDVAAGTYTVIATDRLGCTSAPVSVTVDAIETITFTAEPQCYDGTDGQIVVTVNAGNGDYVFSLDGTTWQTPTPASSNTYTFSGLSDGNYTVYVQDGRGCTENTPVTINPQLIATATPTNASCTPTGEILVNPTGGSGGYEFSVVTDGSSAGTYAATNPVTGLAAGTYDVYVRDDVGCEYVVQDIIIDSVAPLEITATDNQPTCNGDTGSIDVTIVANTGEAPYTITISDSGGVINTINNFVGSSISFDNLAPEDYTILIEDALGCDDSETVELVDPTAIVMDIDPVLPPGCVVDPAQTGFNFINIDPNDYLPNTLQYSLDNGVTWVDFTTTNGQIRGLNSGDVVHPVLQIVENGTGTPLCLEAYGPYEIPFNVTGLIVNPIITPGNCSVGLTVTVEAVDGTGPFEFAINSPTGWQPADAAYNGTLGDPDRTRTYTGLTPGVDYKFYVRDATGCVKENNENIYDDFTPTVPITSTINNQACFGANSGQITFSIDNTSGDLSNDFTWTLYQRDANNEGVAVAGYTNIAQSGFADIVVTGLAPGTYYIVLSNTGGVVCEFGAQDVEIIEGTEISGQVTKVRDITCSVDGLVRIENVVGGFPGYTYTFNVTNGTGVLSGNTITVAAGTVTGSPVTVEAFAQDTNGCGPVSLGTVALTLSPSPNIVSAIPASCDVNKTITINVNNGTAPYSYSIDGGTTFTSPTTNTSYVAQGLTPGSYDVVVRDANGCTDTSNGIIVNPDIDFNLTVTQNATCIPGNDGEVEINVTSGAGGNYNYSFDTGEIGTITSPATSTTVVSLAPGVHNVTVTDVNSGCSEMKAITVQDPVEPSFTYVAENSLCSGDNSGTITLTAVDNGILPVTYTISPVAGTYDGDSTFTNLPPNTYSITGTAANGCTTTVTDIVITEYIAVAPSTPIVTEFACTTGNTVNVASVELPSGTAGGSGTYTRVVFTYTPNSGSVEILDSSNFIFTTTNTSGGTVDITVYDDQGCSGTTSATIQPFNELSNPVVTLDNAITCSIGEDITVTYTSTTPVVANITIEGTSNGYGPVTNTTGDFDNLPTGDYEITIENPTTGCELVTYYTVDDEPTFDIIITDIEDVDCQGDSNGSAVLSFSPSTPYTSGYTYTVYTSTGTATSVTGAGTGGTPTTITGLSAGTYYIRIDMGANSPFCEAQSANFTISEPINPLSVSGVVNPVVSCNNGSDATITATATGGWGTYVYQLEETSNPGVAYAGNTYSSNNIFTGLPAGDYTVVVRDKDGVAGTYCEASSQIIVANPTLVTFTVNHIDNVCDTSVGGSIEVTAAEGTGTYTYTLSNAGGVVETQILTATTYTFTNLPADIYTVNVVDSNGCDAGTPTNVTINPDVNFLLVETKKVDCSASPDGEVTVDLVNWTSGTSNYTYDVSGSVDGSLMTNVVVTSDPFTVTIPSANNTPQTYTVTVRDLDATPICDVSRTIEIQPEIRPDFTPEVTASLCSGDNSGIITLTAIDNGILPITYTISPIAGTYDGDSTFTDLPPGTYDITGTGTNGCTTTITGIVVTEYAPVAPSTPNVTEFACTTGNTVNVASVELPSGTAGGSGTYTRVVFTYTPNSGSVEILDSSNFIFTTTNTSGGTVDITVYDDQGCSGTTSATIQPFNELSNPVVTLDNAITCSTGEDITVTYTSTTPVVANITIEGTSNGYGPVTNTTGDFDNLPTGDYEITIENPTTGCELVTYYTVNNEPVFDLLITDVQNESCRENDDGSVLMEFSSSTPYTGQYDYVVYDASDDSIYRTVTGQTGASPIANLDANPGTSRTYYVIVTMTNTPNCQARTPNFTIYQPENSLLVSAVVDPLVSCTNNSDATITGTASGGWGNYEYQLELQSTPNVAYGGFTYSSDNVFEGIPSGDYRVRVRDGNGCSRSTTVSVANPAPVIFNVTHNDNACDTSVGGSIEVTAAGGTGTYTYTLSNAGGVVETQILTATTHTFSNLPADTYTVNVVDSNGCDAGTPTDVTINPDVNFSLVETKKVDCSLLPDGIVTVDLVNWTSGTSNYTYDVSGSVDGSLMTNVVVTSDPFTVTIPSANDTPQTYTVTVRDLDATPACDVSKDIVIQPEITPVFTAVATVNDICFGSATGVIQMNATDNGIIPLTYSITSVPAGAAAGATFNPTNQTYENLAEAVYTITATGTNGCTTSIDVSINDNDEIDISNAITVTQFACTTGNTVNTAKIVVDKGAITGGTGNYVRVVFEDATGNVLQDDSNFTYISTDLAGGDYTVKVYDENTDCFVSRVVTIDPFTSMTNATITVTKAIDCSTGEDITVKVNPDIANVEYTITGTNTGYTTTVIPATATDVAVFTGLATDSYTIAILNPATGCILEAYHTVQETPSFDIFLTNIERACFGGTGSVDIYFSPATPYTDVYNYEVFTIGGTSTGITGNGTGGTPTTISGIAPGEYYVQVTMPNTPFCTSQTVNFEITQPDNDLTLASDLTYLKCTPPNSGGVKLTANGGWGAYQYELVNNTSGSTIQSFDNNAIITGLTAGDYTATVRDVNGCTETTTFTLIPGTTITGNLNVTPNLCEGEYTATIEVTNIAGGQTQDPSITYSYVLVYPDGTESASQSSPIFTNLPAGVGYSVKVADGYSCDGLLGPVDIIDPIEVVASAEITVDITCNDPQGVIEVTGAGGTGPYMYSMDGITFGNTNTFNVDAGVHQFYVRDSELCVSEPATVTVGAYEPLVATLNIDSAFITCNGDSNAVLSANVQGGFANYEYQLLDGNDAPLSSWQTSNIFSDLNVGTYKINVRSTNRFGVECYAITGEHTITEPEILAATVTSTPVTCFGGNDGTITVNAEGGNNDYEFNIASDPSSPDFPETKFVKNNVFENLRAGVYWITVKDVVGCYLDPIRVEVTQPDEFTATLVGVTEQVCIDDPTPTIELNVQGGTQPYYVSINNVELPTQYTTNSIVLGANENIQGGTSYFITVRDEAGCNVVDPIRVTTGEPVDIQLTVDFEYTCPTGNIILAIVDEAYRNNMSYTLYDGANTLIATNTTGEFIDVPAGSGYYVTATHTISSCSQSSTSSPIDIVDYQPLTLEIDDSVKNTLIANADFGLPPYEYSVDGGDFGPDNEFLILQTKDYTITVRDARGCEVTLTVRGEYISIFVPNLFTPDGDGINDYWYPREVEDYHDIKVYIYDRYARNIADFKGTVEGWDGTYEGTPLPSGDYWYTIYFKELSGQEKKIMGHFTLYR